MRRAGMLGALAAGLTMTVGPVLATDHHRGRTRYPTGHARNGRGHGIPHQGEREIARRLRQRARDIHNRAERLAKRLGANAVKPWNIPQNAVGISRRGRYVEP